MGYNSIWNGDVRLKLKQSEIHPDCDWAYGNYHGNRIAVVNLAFGKLHAGRKSIGKCQNPKLAQRLKESLDNAGKSGYNDMQDACEHVSDRLNKKYVWTDTATKFASIPGWKDEKNYIIPAVHGQLPDGPVNFLQSAAFLALKTAVGLVPVFGSFYQEIVDNCPTLIGNFKKTCEDRQRKMLGLAGY